MSLSAGAWAARCPVGANCRVPTHCPYCVGGSEYRPVDRAIRFPAAVEREAARRAQLQEGKLKLTVGHRDMLALPV